MPEPSGVTVPEVAPVRRHRCNFVENMHAGMSEWVCDYPGCYAAPPVWPDPDDETAIAELSNALIETQADRLATWMTLDEARLLLRALSRMRAGLPV